MGYKVWCLCDAATGYMCTFDVSTSVDSGDVRHGLGTDVVKKLVEPLGSMVYFYFTIIYFTIISFQVLILHMTF